MSRPSRATDVVDPSRRHGVNVIGYHCTTSGVGVVGRALVADLRAAGVPANAVDVEPTWSPRTGAPEAASEWYDTTILAATAERNEQLRELFGPLIAGSRLVVAHWSWELSTVPPEHQPAIDAVDEIWTSTNFMADAYRSATSKPVRVMPFRIDEPAVSAPPVASPDGTFRVLVAFDHLSVIDRKNPFDAITAFQKAFPASGGVRATMTIKTLNGDVWPHSAQRLLDAVGDDERITVVDRHLTPAEHAALMAASDCYLSLHRSEGLGLHLLEAMWLGVPVVATRYAGALDLMDDSCAALVDWTPTAVAPGTASYPAGATWAQPDVGQAAGWLFRLAGEPALRTELGAHARRRMEAQPSHRERGLAMAAAISPSTGTMLTRGRRGLRNAARSATAPVRGFVNTHFEMAKDEVRRQAATVRESVADQQQHIARLTEVTAESGVHQARLVVQLRGEVEALRAEITELRDAVAELGRAIADLASRPSDNG
jgi:hypothetical protein